MYLLFLIFILIIILATTYNIEPFKPRITVDSIKPIESETESECKKTLYKINKIQHKRLENIIDNLEYNVYLHQRLKKLIKRQDPNALDVEAAKKASKLRDNINKQNIKQTSNMLKNPNDASKLLKKRLSPQELLILNKNRRIKIKSTDNPIQINNKKTMEKKLCKTNNNLYYKTGNKKYATNEELYPKQYKCTTWKQWLEYDKQTNKYKY